MMTSSPWLSDFAQPPLDFRPVPFWSWNETMEPAEVRRQCRVIRDAGWGGAFLHARIGLRTEYLGEAWFEACAAAIDECKKIGLKVWLYDEEGWPSGISGGTVPLADETFRHKALFARPVGVEAPPDSVPVGLPQRGLQVYHWTAPLGSWRFNGVCYADLLSRDAMAAFLDDAYASYHRRFGADYGNTIVAEFLDEPCAMVHVLVPAGTLPFTDCIFDAFIEDHGYDVRPHLHLLFQEGEGSARIRIHYGRTASRLFEINFTKQLADWCAAHGIALTGHYMEGNLYDQQCKGNSIPQNYRHQQIPGIDHLCMQVAEIITAKQCHGVVNQYAKPRMLCEAYGASGQNISFADRWWIGIHLLSLGVTLFNPHLSLFTMAGCRKRDFPPNLFFQQPWWPANHAVDEPLSRLCVALSQGRSLAEALVLHPQESAAALLCVRTDWDNPAALDGSADVSEPAARDHIQRLDDDFQALVRSLLGQQRVFDLGDEIILRDVGSVEFDAPSQGPLLRVGEMTYPVVILPSMATLAASTFRLLQEFHRLGGPIFLAGDAPTLLEGLPSAELATLLAGCPQVAPSALSSLLPSPFVRLETESDTSEIFVQVRDLPNGDRLVFLADRRRGGSPVEVTVHLGGHFASVHLLDPFTGKETPVGRSLSVSLIFHASSVRLLRLSQSSLPEDMSPPPMEGTVVLRSEFIPDENWHVERLDDNSLTLDNATWREADFADFTATPIPVVAIQGRLDTLRYRGPLDLRYVFQVTDLAPHRKVHLVVECAERYRITVNGTEVRPAGLPPYLDDFRFIRMDISGLIHSGENSVELHLSDFVFADNDAPRARQSDRTGTEIEAIYLVGDFHVSSRPAVTAETGPNPVTKVFPFSAYTNEQLPPVRMHYIAADSLALSEPRELFCGDVVAQGLPFYAGRLRLTSSLPNPLAHEVELSFSELDAKVAAVEADGVSLGHIFTSPLSVTVPAGTLNLAVTLYSSLRNLLGPHHHESGEPVNTAPWYYLPSCGEGPARADNTLAWANGTFQSPNHRPSYACVSFGQLGSITLHSSLEHK